MPCWCLEIIDHIFQTASILNAIGLIFQIKDVEDKREGATAKI